MVEDKSQIAKEKPKEPENAESFKRCWACGKRFRTYGSKDQRKYCRNCWNARRRSKL